MVHILDDTSEVGAHDRNNQIFSFLLRHLIKSRASTKSGFFYEMTHILSSVRNMFLSNQANISTPTRGAFFTLISTLWALKQFAP